MVEAISQQLLTVLLLIGVRGEIDLGGTGMLSRQDWVEVRGAAAVEAGRPRAPKTQSPQKI